jgi:hypothetical protein
VSRQRSGSAPTARRPESASAIAITSSSDSRRLRSIDSAASRGVVTQCGRTRLRACAARGSSALSRGRQQMIRGSLTQMRRLLAGRICTRYGGSGKRALRETLGAPALSPDCLDSACYAEQRG